jgi:predicted transcriptional regulator
MDEDHLNLEIRKFLKKIGIKSQQLIDQDIKNALSKGEIKIGSEVNLEMQLSINLNLDVIHKIGGTITIK